MQEEIPVEHSLHVSTRHRESVLIVGEITKTETITKYTLRITICRNHKPTLGN